MGSPKIHPFKIKLSTTADRVLVLNEANRQRYKLRSLEINTTSLLQADELNKLKKFRLHCQELNKAAHRATEKRPFFTVSSRLKVLRINGELTDYTAKCVSIRYLTSTSREFVLEKSNKLLVEKSSNSCSSDVDGVIIASACEQVEIDRCHALLNQQLSSPGLTAVDKAADGNTFFEQYLTRCTKMSALMIA